MSDLDLLQNIFIVFYAIFWGVVANVEPKWRAFNWPLALKYERPRRRLAVALLVLNLVPIAYFIGALLLLTKVKIDGTPVRAAVQVFLAIAAAHAPFALHRLWVSLLECRPQSYYYSELDAGRPLSVEPILDAEGKNGPALFPKWWAGDFLAALIHLALCAWAAFALSKEWYGPGLIVVLAAVAIIAVWAFKPGRESGTPSDR